MATFRGSHIIGEHDLAYGQIAHPMIILVRTIRTSYAQYGFMLHDEKSGLCSIGNWQQLATYCALKAAERSFHRRMTLSEPLWSQPSTQTLAGSSTNRRPSAAGPSIHLAAITRSTCPLEKIRTLPLSVRTCETTRSARSVICKTDSPPGHPSRKSSHSGRSRWISTSVHPSY